MCRSTTAWTSSQRTFSTRCSRLTNSSPVLPASAHSPPRAMQAAGPTGRLSMLLLRRRMLTRLEARPLPRQQAALQAQEEMARVILLLRTAQRPTNSAHAQRYWDQHLVAAEFAYNNSVQALGADPRKSIANLETDFPALAKEISTSRLCAEESFFSSVLRVGSPGIHLWTHYDVMDNALIQVLASHDLKP